MGQGKRSKIKGPFIDEGVIRALNRHEKTPSIPIKIYSRRSMIVPRFIGKNVGVYNGMKWVNFLVSSEHVGHKFGEFSPTRTVKVKHAGKKKAGKK